MGWLLYVLESQHSFGFVLWKCDSGLVGRGRHRPRDEVPIRERLRRKQAPAKKCARSRSRMVSCSFADAVSSDDGSRVGRAIHSNGSGCEVGPSCRQYRVRMDSDFRAGRTHQTHDRDPFQRKPQVTWERTRAWRAGLRVAARTKGYPLGAYRNATFLGRRWFTLNSRAG